MPSLIFEKCCGCIELKTGCFIIGYLELVSSIILSILTALGIAGAGVLYHEGKDEAMRSGGLILMIILSVLLFFLLLFLTFVIVLLVGLHKNKPGHLKAYLVYSVIFLIFYIIQFLATVIGGAATVGAISQSLLVIVLNAYFILVIRSMYHEMKETPSRGPAIYSAP